MGNGRNIPAFCGYCGERLPRIKAQRPAHMKTCPKRNGPPDYALAAVLAFAAEGQREAKEREQRDRNEQRSHLRVITTKKSTPP